MVDSAYTVETEMLFDNRRVLEGLAQVGRAFREVNDLLKNTQEGIGRFAADLKELTSGTRGINKLVAGFEKLSTMKLGGGMLDGMERMNTLTRTMAESQAEMATSMRETAAALKEAAAVRMPRLPTPGASGGGRGGHGASLHSEIGNVAIGAQMLGDSGMGWAEKSIMSAMDVDALLSQFRQQNGINDKDIASIRGKAQELVRSVPGSQIAENIHSILDLYTITANVGEAVGGAKAMVTARQVMSSLPGAHSGDTTFAAAQAIEVMQRFYNPQTHMVDINAFMQQLNAMVRVAVSTGGRVSGQSYLGFAKQARMSGMLANDEFLYGDLPALLISQGGSRSGTGDAATYRQFIQGRMTENAFGQLQKTGLIDKKAEWSHGQVHDMNKHLIGAGEFVENPAAWVRDVLLPTLKKRGINVNDRAALGNSIAQWASTNTGLGFLSEWALGMQGVLKEKGKIAGTTTDPMSVIMANNPMQKLKEFQAAENEFMVTAGSALMGPALDALRGLTQVLHGLTDWARAHPAFAKDMFVVAGGVAAFSKAFGDLGMIVFVGAPAISGIRALTSALTGLVPSVTGLAAVAGRAAPAVSSAANPWGVAETWGGAALRWGGKVAGALGLGALAWEAGKSVATSPDWQAFGDHIQKAADAAVAKANLHATININVDGKKAQTVTTTFTPSVQGGRTGFDSTRHPYPAGPPAGTGR